MINDINTFIEMWLNCDVLNHAYKYFNVYVSDSYDEKVRYYISPETLLKNENDNSDTLFFIIRSYSNVEYQKVVKRLMLEPDTLFKEFMIDTSMKWGDSYKYYEASLNFENLYENRFDDSNFKLLWITMILNDLLKFSEISFMPKSNVYINEIIEKLKIILNDKDLCLPFLHMKSKRQFMYHFNKNIKNLYLIESLDDLLVYIYHFTLRYLLNNKILVIVTGVMINEPINKDKEIIRQMIRDKEYITSEQLTIDKLL